MALSHRLHRQLTETLGAKIVTARPLTGGDINQAYALTLSDKRTVFLKTHSAAPQDMFRREAEGLGWLAKANALKIPQVIAFNDEAGAPFLVLEYLRAGRRDTHFDEALGHGLAALHRAAPKHFGLDSDNYIGRLEQDNRLCSSWVEFYRTARLEPMFAHARNKVPISVELQRDFNHILTTLPERVGPTEAPARLHGDLWSGNLQCSAEGQPALIDPAVYGGHREIDLAMMKLFGGFSSRVFAAYHESYPLAAGFQDRVPLYQLYPILVHVALFGSGYLGALHDALRAILRS